MSIAQLVAPSAIQEGADLEASIQKLILLVAGNKPLSLVERAWVESHPAFPQVSQLAGKSIASIESQDEFYGYSPKVIAQSIKRALA